MAGGCTSNEAGSPTTFALAAGSFGTAPQAGEPSSKRQIEQRASRPHETDFAGAKTMISPLAGKLDKSGGRNDGRVNASSQAPPIMKQVGWECNGICTNTSRCEKYRTGLTSILRSLIR